MSRKKTFPKLSCSSPSWVATSILRGIAEGQNKIFPSPLFVSMLVLNRIFGFIRTLYQPIEYQKYKKWLKNQSEF